MPQEITQRKIRQLEVVKIRFQIELDKWQFPEDTHEVRITHEQMEILLALINEEYARWKEVKQQEVDMVHREIMGWKMS